MIQANDIQKVGAVKKRKDLKVLWYFEPDDIREWEETNQKIFDPFTYPPSDDEKAEVTNERWEGKFIWPELMTEGVKNYWKDVKGNPRPERTFRISYKGADSLIHTIDQHQGTIGKIPQRRKALALWVKDIGTLKDMDAGWIPFHDDNNFLYKDVLPQEAKNGKTLHIYKLDPYFFEAWPKKYVNQNKLPRSTSFYKIFKGYIKRKVGKKEKGNFPYEDLFLVGRIVDINGKKGVVIIVGAVEFQIYPWTHDGPDGHGGGGAWP